MKQWQYGAVLSFTKLKEDKTGGKSSQNVTQFDLLTQKISNQNLMGVGWGAIVLKWISIHFNFVHNC